MPAFPATTNAVRRDDLAGAMESFDLENDRRGFIGTQILPIFEAGAPSGKFRKIKAEELLRLAASVDRAPGGGYNRDSFKFEDDSFDTYERGAEEPVDDRLSRIYRNYIDLEMLAQKRAVDRVLRAQEMRIAAAIFNTTTWTGASYFLDTAVTWQTYATATPIADVNFAKRKIRANFGRYPNTMVYNYNNHMHIREIAEVQDRIKSSGAGESVKAKQVTVQQIAEVFDIPNVLVAGGTKNTANEGQAATFSEVWSDSYVWIGCVAESNDIEEPCVGRSFHYAEDGSTPLGTSESYRDETVRGDVIRVRHEVGEKILYVQAGFLLKID